MVKDSVVRGETVLFLGESHTLSFAEKIVGRGDAPPLVCQPIFLANAVCLANVTNPDGVLNAQVRQGLRIARLLVESPNEFDDDENVFTARDLSWRRVAQQRFGAPPLIVVCLGSYDLFASIVQFPGDDFDLPELPFMHPLAPSLIRPRLPGTLSIHHATTFFTARVKQLQHAFVRLRELGFYRIAFLAIPPPTVEDVSESVSGLGGRPAGPKMHAAFRYKAALHLNALIAYTCQVEGVDFLDSWPMLTENGVARPGVLSDPAHLSDATIDELLIRLIVPAVERSREKHGSAGHSA